MAAWKLRHLTLDGLQYEDVCFDPSNGKSFIIQTKPHKEKRIKERKERL